ncbi:MAG: cupin domain-containing protein [Fibrobacter sp.]|nr:cupin domain-containing protein [Fibrobacter sp.]
MEQLLPYVLIKLDNVQKDAPLPGHSQRKLEETGNNGRKIFATSIMPGKGEWLIVNEEWIAPAVYPSGNGGIEISTFTEYSSQDRHRHERGIEIYTVLKGKLALYINDKEIPVLQTGDEIVILPGTVHQVKMPSFGTEKKEEFELLVRVHSISCFGEDDKFVQLKQDGEWVRWSELATEERKAAYRL